MSFLSGREELMQRGIVLLALLWYSTGPVRAQAVPEWSERTKLSVLLFGDAYWMVKNHDPDIEGETGFWFRRIYLTLDHKLAGSADLRLRLEASSPGDFESSDRLDPIVKDAWVRWRREHTSVIAGLSSSPTWDVVEAFWGYRAVEKTPLDLQRMGSSPDLGLAFQGSFGAERRFRYHAMLANGSGTSAETNKGKKVMVSFGYFPSEALVGELYGDFEDRNRGEQRATVQAFFGCRWRGGRVGFQLAHQERDSAGASLVLDLASAFAVVDVGHRMKVFVRVDRMFDPNPEGDRISYLPFSPRADSTLALTGFEVALAESLSVIPSVEAVFYDHASGEEPDDDLISRVTLSVHF